MRVLDRSLSRFPGPLRTLIDWAVTITLAVVGVLVFQAEVAKPYRIPSASMEPTLHCAKPADGCRSRFSDRVIANRIVYRFHPPERGDIIVFKAPTRVEAACNVGGTLIKRIIGLPGERVSMRHGYVSINGSRLAEPYLAAGDRGRESGEWPRSPSDGYFVLGDNRAMSCDSRRWGFVPRQSIIGRADIRYWPPNRAGAHPSQRSFAQGHSRTRAHAPSPPGTVVQRHGPASASGHLRRTGTYSPASRRTPRPGHRSPSRRTRRTSPPPRVER